MKTYKLKENTPIWGRIMVKGRVIATVDTETIVIATPTEETVFIYRENLNYLINHALVEDADLKNEKWLHPHLHEKVRKEFEKSLLDQ